MEWLTVALAVLGEAPNLLLGVAAVLEAIGQARGVSPTAAAVRAARHGRSGSKS